MSPETEKSNQITLIKPGGAWLSLDLKDFWTYRELLYFLTWRDVKVRYKQTAIGVVWAILQPVLTTIIFTVIFSTLARFESQTVPYPLFALSGFLIWLFVFNAISFAANSLVGNANLVTKIYFPRLIVPISATLSGLFDLLFSFAVLAVLMIYYLSQKSLVLSWQIFSAPVFIFLAILLTVSLGTLFSALNVRFRDVKFALPFALQVWMFASPIFYPPEILSEKARFVLAFNPLTGILQGFRAALFGGNFDWFAIGVSAAMTVVLMLVSLFVFKRMEDDFADLI
ncbi:MAG TPA: ABC transporter permease [Pyrinomonadaceae bacterium]|nr:ABC transporter permease [Pyrinomonadaceae bacterium]